jgi:hypothetical protein
MESSRVYQQVKKRRYTYTMEYKFSHKEEWTHISCRKIDITRDHHIKQNNPVTENKYCRLYLSYVETRKTVEGLRIRGWGGGRKRKRSKKVVQRWIPPNMIHAYVTLPW